VEFTKQEATQVKDYQPTARDLEIYKQVCRGRTSQAVIAEQFHLTQQRVSQICQQVDQWLAPQIADRVLALKARHTQKLEAVWQEAMGGFARSQEPAETVTEDSDGKGVSRVTRGQAGNPAFLAQARGALDDIRRIWGMNEPEVRMEGAGIPTAGKSREQLLAEYRARFDSLMQRLQSPQEN
jgi:hypothetical protein